MHYIVQSIEIIENFMRNTDKNICDDALYEALQDAVRSMKQDIPKKPIFKQKKDNAFVNYGDGNGEIKEEKWADWTCQNCGEIVGQQFIPRTHNQRKCKFCSQCGCAIDWRN